VRDCRQQRKNKHGCRNCGYVAAMQTTNWITADFCEDLWSILLLSAPSPDPRLMLSAGNATKVLQDLDEDDSYFS
jgi:hypothetical protein